MKLAHLLGAAIGSVALLGAPFASAAVAQERLASVVSASGSVFVQKANGKQESAKTGTPLNSGDTLVVSDNSTASVKYVDSARVEKYLANNRIKILRGAGQQGSQVTRQVLARTVTHAVGHAGAAGVGAAGAGAAGAGALGAGALGAGAAGAAGAVAGAAGLGSLGLLGLAALGIGAAAAIANNDDNNASN